MNGEHLAAKYALALLVPLLATLWLTPVAGWLGRRLGFMDHPSETRHHRTATPYLGGVAIAAGLVVVGAMAASSSGQILTVLACGATMMVLGLVDDKRGLQPVSKLIVEVGAASALWLSGVGAGLFHVPVLDYGLTVLWVVAVTNAINLIDNMDGLAAGVTAIAGVTFFHIAATHGEYLVASFALALTGASLGFLRHNFPPARIFLGDAGSLMLGFFLAALALKLDLVGESGVMRSAIPLLVLGVPLFDMTLVIITRLREHRPISLGGTDHSSHRLTEIGFSGRGVALATYGAQIVCCLLAVALMHLGDVAAYVVVACAGIVAVGVLLWFLGIRAPQPVRQDVEASEVGA